MAMNLFDELLKVGGHATIVGNRLSQRGRGLTLTVQNARYYPVTQCGVRIRRHVFFRRYAAAERFLRE
jgi:hypothetical protein